MVIKLEILMEGIRLSCPAGEEYEKRFKSYISAKNNLNFKDKIKKIAFNEGFEINEDSIKKDNKKYNLIEFSDYNQDKKEFCKMEFLQLENKNIMEFRNYISWENAPEYASNFTKEQSISIKADFNENFAKKAFFEFRNYFEKIKGDLKVLRYQTGDMKII
jgi:hypothetical protein